MPILKKGYRFLIAFMMLAAILSGIVSPAAAAGTASRSGEEIAPRFLDLTREEMLEHMRETYKDVQSLSGRRSFYNRCSTLVNYTTYALGLQNTVYSCNGNQEYNLYEGTARTDVGYDVVLYSAADYSLSGALKAMSDNGTKDVYNIIIGWQSGSSYAARRYGHTCFIFGILDGMVYFYESYGLSIAGTYYRAGTPIVCTIDQFAAYYDRWARFEGAVHFDVPEAYRPDKEAPVLSPISVGNLSTDGFTLTFDATDNKGITELYAKVWTYGGTEEGSSTILPVNLNNGVATLRVDTEDFGGFIGRYYVVCYGTDEWGNVTSTTLSNMDCINLYTSDPQSGTYRVLSQGSAVCNAPYTSVNNTATQEYFIAPGQQISIIGQWTNDLGELWYQLEDGCWVNADTVVWELQWEDVLSYINDFLESFSSNQQ